jgi:hypothetical protein
MNLSTFLEKFNTEHKTKLYIQAKEFFKLFEHFETDDEKLVVFNEMNMQLLSDILIRNITQDNIYDFLYYCEYYQLKYMHDILIKIYKLIFDNRLIIEQDKLNNNSLYNVIYDGECIKTKNMTCCALLERVYINGDVKYSYDKLHVEHLSCFIKLNLDKIIHSGTLNIKLSNMSSSDTCFATLDCLIWTGNYELIRYLIDNYSFPFSTYAIACAIWFKYDNILKYLLTKYIWIQDDISNSLYFNCFYTQNEWMLDILINNKQRYSKNNFKRYCDAFNITELNENMCNKLVQHSYLLI